MPNLVARRIVASLLLLSAGSLFAHEGEKTTGGLERLKHNNPGLVVDLGVGLWAWPVPCDADGDGDFDLIVSCPDKPYNGTYLFENPGDGQTNRDEKFPVFKPARRLSAGQFNVTPSYVDGRLVVTTPGHVHPDFLTVGLNKPQKLSLLADPIGKNPDWFKPHQPGVYKLRHNQWKFVDYDGDKALDLVVALENWSEYGWDDAWDANGQWKNGPLHGLLYLFRNTGSTEQPKYAEPKLLTCAVASSLVPSPPSAGERARVRGPSGGNAVPAEEAEERTPHPNPLPSKARGEGTGKEPLSLSPQSRGEGTREEPSTFNLQPLRSRRSACRRPTSPTSTVMAISTCSAASSSTASRISRT